jgi:hypothetical protein
MIDLLFAFPSEEEAQAALAPSGLWTGEAWDTSRVMAPISITMLDGSQPAGFWLGATVNELDDDLAPLTQAALDPSLAVGLKPSEYVISTVWPIENVDAIAEISPLWAGRPYRFPGLPQSDETLAPSEGV